MGEFNAKVISPNNRFLVDYITLYTDGIINVCETLPEPSIEYKDKITQYTGQTSGKLINGYFYKCVEESGTYKWVQIDTQPYTLGKFLSVWDCTTGLPESSPSASGIPYNYTTGDYYMIGKVGDTNYKPSGTQYTGVASTTVDSSTPKINDIYKYDGLGNWIKVSDDSKKITWGSITGTLSNQADLVSALQSIDKVFVVTYGTTTYDEVVAARNAGKEVIVIYTNKYYRLYNIDDDYCYFNSMFGSSSNNFYLNRNGWTATSVALEHTDNKVTSISAASTDAQYPSAKCVYDNLATKANITQQIDVANTVLEQTLAPNTLYVFATRTNNLAFSFGTPISGIENEYKFKITIDSTTIPTISGLGEITWVGGSQPAFSAGKIYECSIVNGIGAFIEI